MMTSTALPMVSARSAYRVGGLELVVSHLAVGMLRWSEHSAAQRLLALEQAVQMRGTERHVSSAADYSRMVRFSRLG